MVAHRKVEGRRIAPAANLDCVIIREAVRRGLVRRIRHTVEQLLAASLRGGELLLQRLQLLLDPFELRKLLGCRLALDFARGAQLFGAGLNLADCLICRQELVEDVGGPFSRECEPEALRVVSGCTQIDHWRESR